MRSTFYLIIATLFCCVFVGMTQGYTHPCIPNTSAELATIKANLDQQPWKQGYAVLSADSHSQLTYNMQGPFATVTRNPNLNLNQWRNDMTAVYFLAKMWYFTGNTAYAQKAHDILIAWANTQTSFGGQESGLDLGDYAPTYGGGASILRGTWSGWTAADTTTVKNYFLNVFWPATAAGGYTAGEANKGSLNMAAGIAIAAFCDDTAKFNHVIDTFRTYPGAGLPNTLPTGEMGETGRDAGHCYADLKSKAFIAEVAWKQGIDLYSELDNRLLACTDYYCRNTFTSDTPFVPYGTVDYTYYDNADGPYTANRAALYLVQNAYKNRKGLPTPWIDRKLEEQHVDADNWMYAKTADSTTATVPAAIVRPAVSLASSGLTLTTLGSQTSGRSASYANGVWTVSGLGGGVWTDGADDCQFVYRQMTGDCAIVARVNSFTYSGSNNGKAGLMIRDNLIGTVSQRGWIGIVPAATNLMESHMRGWTETWGGSGWDDRSQQLPPGMPYWLKMERRGNLITTYSSQDGTSWAAIISSYYGNLPSTVNIGLFVCSGNTTAVTAAFANVAFTGGSGGLVTTPAAPAALIATAAPTSNFAVTVRWLPSFGASAYDLLRSTNPTSGYTTLASNLTGTSYVDTAVSAGTNYYYRARAKNSAGTSGDSMTFGGSHSLLVAPMVNIAVGGTSSASFQSGGGIEGSDQAFNRDPGSKWYGWNASTGWLQYDFGEGNAKVVKRYTINCADVAERDPKNWTFLGSQDGSNWTTLNSQSNQSFAVRMQMNTYNIGNTTAYRYYRLNVTANNGATGVAISELGLWSPYALVAWYELDGNTIDSSGNGRNATATGSPAYTGGCIGQAIDLDGSNDVVTLPAGVANSDDITVAAWVNWDGGNNWQRIFDFGNNTSQYLFLTPKSGNNTLRFAIKNGGSEQIVQTSALATGQWVHVAVTLAGNLATLYVDGVPVATNNAVTINPSNFNPTVNYIGDSQYSADPLFNGRVDDFCIYSYALSSTEIAELAALGWAIPGTIEGEDYDIGGEGVTYHDTTAGNSGGQYRSDDVDVETCGEGGYNIGYVANGEWLEYTLDVASAGSYDIVVRAASTNANGRFHIEFDGVDLTGLRSVPNTGNWQTYTNVTITGVNLNAGLHVMRVFMDVGNWNLNKVTFQ